MSIVTTYQSGIYILTAEQIVHSDLESVWAFFSSPKNLNKITPPDMGFEITSGSLDHMYAGQLITYNVEILPNIKQNWVTEITQVNEQNFFIDEQRFGPYAMWHHEHHFFEQEDGSVLMRDIVSYKLPLGFLGKFVAGSAIKKRVYQIFEHRNIAIEELFPSKPNR